jgi:hypothetical protein
VEFPEFLTLREVAKLLKVSPETITRKFQNYPGVIDLGTPRQPAILMLNVISDGRLSAG